MPADAQRVLPGPKGSFSKRENPSFPARQQNGAEHLVTSHPFQRRLVCDWSLAGCVRIGALLYYKVCWDSTRSDSTPPPPPAAFLWGFTVIFTVIVQYSFEVKPRPYLPLRRSVATFLRLPQINDSSLNTLYDQKYVHLPDHHTPTWF